MRRIFGLLLRGKVLDIQRKCGLYTRAANTRAYIVTVRKVFEKDEMFC